MRFPTLAAAAALALAPFAAQAITTGATEVYADFGTYVGPQTFSAGQVDPDSALGMDSSSFFRMGRGGFALFGFGSPITGSALVLETTNGCSDRDDDGLCDGFKEQIRVFAVTDAINPVSQFLDGSVTPPGGVSTTNYDFSTLPGLSGVTELTVDPLGNAHAQGQGAKNTFDLTSLAGPLFYILIQDVTPDLGGALGDSGFSNDGFDIEQVKVDVIPLPAGALLIASAFAAVGAARRFGRKAA